jgi:hypothetical protein
MTNPMDAFFRGPGGAGIKLIKAITRTIPGFISLRKRFMDLLWD